MSETKMPAVEAGEMTDERELVSYELAFHVLPTIAEGEVTKVVETIKNQIIRHGGEVTLEESPARVDLAYEIIKYLEGRNRKFGSAYFGWVRFRAEAKSVVKLTEEVAGMKELLRHLLIKLTRVEEENPCFYHELMVNEQSSKIREIDNVDSTTETKEGGEEGDTDSATDEPTEVDGTTAPSSPETKKAKKSVTAKDQEASVKETGETGVNKL